MSSSAKQLASHIADRDRRILDHVARYRLTTHQVLHKLFFPQRQPNGLTKVTARLCRQRRLNRFTLRHPRVYFTLGNDEARDRGLPPNRCQPLGPQSLPIQYAVLAYATLGATQHRRLTSKELRALCPWMAPGLARLPHCLDNGRPPVLETLQVNLGGTPDHVARKCDAAIAARRGLPEFDRLLGQRGFRLVVLTATAEKAAAIRGAINQHVWPDGLQIHLAVVSDLLQLTASYHNDP
jgi:hypothetical protein